MFNRKTNSISGSTFFNKFLLSYCNAIGAKCCVCIIKEFRCFALVIFTNLQIEFGLIMKVAWYNALYNKRSQFILQNVDIRNYQIWRLAFWSCPSPPRSRGSCANHSFTWLFVYCYDAKNLETYIVSIVRLKDFRVSFLLASRSKPFPRYIFLSAEYFQAHRW